MSGKVEMPYRHETVKIDPNDPHTPLPRGDSRLSDGAQRTDYFAHGDGVESLAPDDSISVSPSRKLRSMQTKKRAVPTPTNESPTSYTTFPEIENYDPTYGLRPEGVPSHSGYGAFGRLWDAPNNRKAKGLSSLMSLAEEITFMEADEADPDDVDFDLDNGGDGESVMVDSDDGAQSFDAVDASPSLRAALHSRGTRGSGSVMGMSVRGNQYQSGNEDLWSRSSSGALPIARPRIFHAQSQIRAPSEVGRPHSYLASPNSPSGTTKAITSGRAGRASSVRSSAGGSSVGLGMARSILNGQGGNSSRQIWPDRMLPPQFRGMAGSPSTLATAPRPDLSGSHSRSESVPPPTALTRTARGQSAMHNVVTRSSAASVHGAQTAERSNNTPRQRPKSMQAYPLHRIVTPSKTRQPSGRHQASLSGSPPGANQLGMMNAARYNNIVLPLNDSVSQLASLSHSNHTLSPYARSHEHIAVRSFPYLSRANSLVGTQQTNPNPASLSMTQAALGHGSSHMPTFENSKVKAKRKRLFRIGGNTANDVSTPELAGTSHTTNAGGVSPDKDSAVLDLSGGRAPRRPAWETRRSYGFPSNAFESG